MRATRYFLASRACCVRFSTLAVVALWLVAGATAYADTFAAGSGVILTALSTGAQEGSTTVGDLIPDALVGGITSASTTYSTYPGSGNGSADLAAGTLKIFSESNDIGVETLAFAGFAETLTATTSGTMQFVIDLSGSADRSSYYLNSLARPGLVFSFAVNGSSWLTSGSEASYPVWDLGYVFNTTSGDCNEFRPDSTQVGQSQCTLTYGIPVQAGDVVGFAFVLDGLAREGSVDLSHTMDLDVTGVAFTSASGAFLTGPAPAATPEPSSFVLAFSGLLFGARLLRRRRR